MKGKAHCVLTVLIVATLLTIILQNCKTSSLKSSGYNAPVTERASVAPASRIQRTNLKCRSEDENESEQSYLIPDDVILDKLNDSSLTIIYWRYVNTIQFLCKNQTRLGQMKDGGKELCTDEKYRPRRPCLVYSFGSNYDFDFEKDMAERFGCEVHTFDPSMAITNHQAPSYTQFHRIGLAERDYRNTRIDWNMKTLSAIINQLKHRQRSIDVVKIDIEGDEWKVLPELFQSGELQRVRQICIEIHFGRVVPNLINYTTHWGNVTLAAQLKVLRQLHHEGFRIFMREHNTYRVQYFEKPFREITNVNELSLVNIHLEYGTKDFDYSRTFGDKTSNFDVIR